MISDYSCPVCDASQWRHIQQFKYYPSDHKRTKPSSRYRHYLYRVHRYLDLLFYNAPHPPVVSVNTLAAYERLRRRVLFECWFPGAEEVTLTSQLCMNCGFIAYSPRPTEAELRAKYEFLLSEQEQRGSSTASKPAAEPLDHLRAQRIFETVVPTIAAKPLRVLDYGGGDGRLLQPFLQRGDQCFLVDYASDTLPGIIKLGDEIEAVPQDATFDIIICSHVLEHLADPLGIVKQLGRFLLDGGVIYAEVPQEIWGGIHIEYDPVTHINFFSQHTLEVLFQRTGYQILTSQVQLGNYGKFRKEVMWLLARYSGGDIDIPAPFANPEKLLHPGRMYSLGRLFRQFVLLKS